jgi:hypothetical protein
MPELASSKRHENGTLNTTSRCSWTSTRHHANWQHNELAPIYHWCRPSDLSAPTVATHFDRVVSVKWWKSLSASSSRT